jgi:hypothetical protein
MKKTRSVSTNASLEAASTWIVTLTPAAVGVSSTSYLPVYAALDRISLIASASESAAELGRFRSESTNITQNLDGLKPMYPAGLSPSG